MRILIITNYYPPWEVGGYEQLCRDVAVRLADRGVLATLLPEGGFPYASLVELLPTPDGDVVLLLSRLAEHQQNLAADPRASVLIAQSYTDRSALARPRVTLVGRVELVQDRQQFAETYVAHHPAARAYVAMPDFQFYRLHVARARYIAGFGQMGWIKNQAYRAAWAKPNDE